MTINTQIFLGPKSEQLHNQGSILKMQVYANSTYISYQKFYLRAFGPKMSPAQRCCLLVQGTVLVQAVNLVTTRD